MKLLPLLILLAAVLPLTAACGREMTIETKQKHNKKARSVTGLF